MRRRRRASPVWALAFATASAAAGAAGCGPRDAEEAAGAASRDKDAATACGPAPEAGDAGDGGADASATSCGAPTFGGCADGLVVGILAAENAAELAMVEAVRPNLRRPRVVAYAETVLTDHSLLGEQLKGAARASGVTSVESGVSRALARAAAVEVAAMAAVDPADVDDVYIEYEILAHLQSLSAVDRIVLPNVAGPRIAWVAQTTRVFEATHAQLAVAAQQEPTACVPVDAGADDGS